MTGHVVVRILKSSEKHKHIPIIMLTAFKTNPKMGEDNELPADAYLAKPFESADLLKKVQELLKV